MIMSLYHIIIRISLTIVTTFMKLVIFAVIYYFLIILQPKTDAGLKSNKFHLHKLCMRIPRSSSTSRLAQMHICISFCMYVYIYIYIYNIYIYMYCPDPLLPRDSPPHRAAAAALQAAGGQGRRVRHVLAGYIYIYIFHIAGK